MRPHLSLDVRNVPASVAFYQMVFGVAPQKQTQDYAKFDLTQPALNFSLVSSTGRLSSVDHLGIEVESVEEIAAWKERLQAQGILERVEENTACCFARQDKLWFSTLTATRGKSSPCMNSFRLKGLSQTPVAASKIKQPKAFPLFNFQGREPNPLGLACNYKGMTLDFTVE